MEAKIELYHSSREAMEVDLRHAAVVVIDVLRASNSIITAVGNGCRRVLPVMEIYEARALAVRLSLSEAILRCGEREARMIPGFDLGNSPAEYQRERVNDRTLVFCSTNGSRAMVCASLAKLAVVGSFANVSAVVDKLKMENRIVLLCAGRLGRLSLEDTVCAGAFVDMFLRARQDAGKIDDAAAAAHGLFLHHAKELLPMARASEHGGYLVQIGMEEDLQACTQVDTTKVVPVIRVDEQRLVSVSAS